MSKKAIETIGIGGTPKPHVPFINKADGAVLMLVDGDYTCEQCCYSGFTESCKTAPICGSGVFTKQKREFSVCIACGSPRVYHDAYAAINSEDVLTFDDIHCMDCEGETSTHTVTVPADFDIETDFWKEENCKTAP